MKDTYKLVDHILDQLFAAQYRRLQQAIDKLHEANQEAERMKLDGFMYQGKFYRWSRAAAGPGTRRTLNLNLWPEMQEYLVDRQTVDDDKIAINQMLFHLLDPCCNLQHVRDAIPDCIVDTLPPELRAMERMGGPSWQTQRDLRHYNKTLPKVEFYSATRLLF